MSSNTTRQRLLDTAEQLIALQGYANTSLREITARADANLAAVNYHFDSKEGLAKAMLERRLIPLNQKRLEMLDAEVKAARIQGRKPAIRPLMEALIAPMLHFFKDEAGGRYFVRILSRMHTDPDGTIKTLFLATMHTAIESFFRAFSLALPHLTPEILFTRIFFSIGAMAHGAGMLTDHGLTAHPCHPGMAALPRPDTLVQELIGFVTRGMEAP